MPIINPIKKIEISEPYAAPDFMMSFSDNPLYEDQSHMHVPQELPPPPPLFDFYHPPPPPPPPPNMIPPYYCPMVQPHMVPPQLTPIHSPIISNTPPILHSPLLNHHVSPPILMGSSPHLIVSPQHHLATSPHLIVSPPVRVGSRPHLITSPSNDMCSSPAAIVSSLNPLHTSSPQILHQLPPSQALHHFNSNAHNNAHVSGIKCESNRFAQFNQNPELYSNSRISSQYTTTVSLKFKIKNVHISA